MHGLIFRSATGNDFAISACAHRAAISFSSLSHRPLPTVVHTTEPVYEAAAKIMVGKRGMGESLFDFTSIMQNETMINNQVEILKSRTLAEIVINNREIRGLTNCASSATNLRQRHVSASFWRKF